MLLWTWLNTLVFVLANQRLPDAVTEDALNKPWRPIPAGRITMARTRRLLIVAVPLSYGAVCVLGGKEETLLLYTDGVTEAGRPDRPLGEQGLLELCADAPGLPLEAFLEQIERAALTRAQGRLRDDIALLALRIAPQAREEARPAHKAVR